MTGTVDFDDDAGCYGRLQHMMRVRRESDRVEGHGGGYDHARNLAEQDDAGGTS